MFILGIAYCTFAREPSMLTARIRSSVLATPIICSIISCSVRILISASRRKSVFAQLNNHMLNVLQAENRTLDFHIHKDSRAFCQGVLRKKAEMVSVRILSAFCWVSFTVIHAYCRDIWRIIRRANIHCSCAQSLSFFVTGIHTS